MSSCVSSMLGVGLRVVGHRAQQDRDRQLALAVDADEDLALLVDLELEPRAAGRHQVRGEDLLLAVLGLHHVGARRTDELRDDDALGAVDDERAALGHPREVAHEDRLLADLAGLVVDERDGDGQRARVREVLLTALGDRGGRARRSGTRRTARRGCRCSPRSARCRRSSLAVHPSRVSTSHSNERRWISMRLGTSTVLFRRAKVRRVREASTRGKTATPSGVEKRTIWARFAPEKSANGQDSTAQRGPPRGRVSAHGPRPDPRVCGAGGVLLGGCDYRPTRAG